MKIQRKFIRRINRDANFKGLQYKQKVFFPFWRLIFKISMLNSFQIARHGHFYAILLDPTRS